MWQTVMLKSLIFRQIPRRVARTIRPYRSSPENDRMAADQAREMITHLAHAGFPVADKDVLEIGAGWLPTTATVFAANGVRRIVLSDVVRLMDEHTVELARHNVSVNAPELTIPAILPFDYRAPVSLAEIETDSADLIVSRTVLEHVPADALPKLFADCRRILRRGGAMCHIIDHTDHRAHHDPSLSFLDFLRYPPGRWSIIDWLWDCHQNRLRASDFISLFEAAGFEIMMFERFVHPTRAFDVPFAEEFANYDADDRRVCISTVIAT